MAKRCFLVLAMLFVLCTAPIFAEISIDLGITGLGNAVYPGASRPLGASVGVGATMFDFQSLLQVNGSLFSPPIAGDYEDPAVAISAGVFFSPVQYLYMGFRSGMISPPDEIETWTSYGSMVLRVQNQGKGTHFFAESEISFTGVLNKFAMGVNFVL